MRHSTATAAAGQELLTAANLAALSELAEECELPIADVLNEAVAAYIRGDNLDPADRFTPRDEDQGDDEPRPILPVRPATRRQVRKAVRHMSYDREYAANRSRKRAARRDAIAAALAVDPHCQGCGRVLTPHNGKGRWSRPDTACFALPGILSCPGCVPTLRNPPPPPIEPVECFSHFRGAMPVH